MSHWDREGGMSGTFGPEVPCTDCGRVFRNRPDETGALCDECCDERDAHTSALELRMAKARLKVDAAKDVA